METVNDQVNGAARDSKLSAFLALLAQADPGANAFNPWRDHCSLRDVGEHAPAERLSRLRAHLSTTPLLILCGEAPGWKGARYCGVPFGSEALMYGGEIPRIAARRRFTTMKTPMTEPTATMVWAELHRWNVADRVVAFNAFPFHPHPVGKPLKNRTPKITEIRRHLPILEAFLSIFPGVPIVAIGNSAASTFKALGHSVDATIRHPSYGGKADFVRGLAEVLNRLQIGSDHPVLTL